MAKGITTRIRFIEKGEAALRFCPHCGEKAGRRNGMRRGQQQFICRACRKTWVGEMPAPPTDQIYYCKGRCFAPFSSSQSGSNKSGPTHFSSQPTEFAFL